MITSSKFFKKVLFEETDDFDWAREQEDEILSRKKIKSNGQRFNLLKKNNKSSKVSELNEQESTPRNSRLILPKLPKLNSSIEKINFQTISTQIDPTPKNKFINQPLSNLMQNFTFFPKKKQLTFQQYVLNDQQQNSVCKTTVTPSILKKNSITIDTSSNNLMRQRKSHLKLASSPSKSIEKQIKTKTKSLNIREIQKINVSDFAYGNNPEVQIFRRLRDNNKRYFF